MQGESSHGLLEHTANMRNPGLRRLLCVPPVRWLSGMLQPLRYRRRLRVRAFEPHVTGKMDPMRGRRRPHAQLIDGDTGLGWDLGSATAEGDYGEHDNALLDLRSASTPPQAGQEAVETFVLSRPVRRHRRAAESTRTRRRRGPRRAGRP